MVHGKSWENVNIMIEGTLNDAVASLTIVQKENLGFQLKSEWTMFNALAKMMCEIADRNESNQMEGN